MLSVKQILRPYSVPSTTAGAGNRDINTEEQGGDSGKSQNDGCTDGLESSSEFIQSEASGRSSEKQCVDRTNGTVRSE